MLRVFEIIVSNVGTVYSGTDATLARQIYHDYCVMSSHNVGRAGGEEVTLFHNGEIDSEFGYINEQELSP